jgi:hypothetical protein
LRIRALLIACLVAASSLLVAAPAEADPATVYIYKVYFDSRAPTAVATPALTPSMS